MCMKDYARPKSPATCADYCRPGEFICVERSRLQSFVSAMWNNGKGPIVLAAFDNEKEAMDWLVEEWCDDDLTGFVVLPDGTVRNECGQRWDGWLSHFPARKSRPQGAASPSAPA